MVTLLRTKLAVPQARPDLLARHRLTGRLEGLGKPLTLISAPAGYGKSTLLSDWRQTDEGREFLLAWLSLDDDDNDPSRFLTYVAAAIHMVVPDGLSEVIQLFEAAQAPAPKIVLTALINRLAESPGVFALVLDDYHVITNQAVHEAVGFLLDHLPPAMRLVILTRADPPLPLARLRARGQLAELRADDLRFDFEETTAFLKSMSDRSLAPDEIAALEARTEGWIAGLQLAALAMRGRQDIQDFVVAFSGSHRHILDYLVEEVLTRQPQTVQDFLVQTAVLDRLRADLCEAVTGQTNTQTTLNQLERSNLFLIPLDAERRWYRYHHLFADVLRHRLNQADPGAAAELRRRASAWLESQELFPEAIGYALEAGDWDRAVRLIEQTGRQLFLESTAYHRTIERWVGSLPSVMVETRPRLCLLMAWIVRLNVEQADQWTQRAERALDSAQPADDIQNMRGEIAALRAAHAAQRNEPAQAITYAQQAFKALSPDNLFARTLLSIHLAFAHFSQNDLPAAERTFQEAANLGRSMSLDYLALSTSAQLSNVQYSQGKLRLAYETCRKILDWITERGHAEMLEVILVWFCIANVLREWNDLPEATHYASQAAARISQSGVEMLNVFSFLILARIRQAGGNLDASVQMLRKSQQVAERQGLAWADELLMSLEAQLLLAQGRTEEALELARQIERGTEPLSPGLGTLPFVYLNEYRVVTHVQALIAQGRAAHDQRLPVRAFELLEPLGETAEAVGLTWLSIKTHVLRALAHQALDNVPNALSEIGSALRLAEPEGFIRVFADEGAPIAALLRQVPSNKISSSYHARLLLTIGEVNTIEGRIDKAIQPLKPGALLEPLSERELEVLYLIAAGASNNEIAQQLVVSLGTVKKHANNILSKLDVHSRTQAIATARALGLIR